jgi:hypothetical protein
MKNDLEQVVTICYEIYDHMRSEQLALCPMLQNILCILDKLVLILELRSFIIIYIYK